MQSVGVYWPGLLADQRHRDGLAVAAKPVTLRWAARWSRHGSKKAQLFQCAQCFATPGELIRPSPGVDPLERWLSPPWGAMLRKGPVTWSLPKSPGADAQTSDAVLAHKHHARDRR